MLPAQRVRHDDFELRAAVGSHRVGRDGNLEPAVALRRRDRKQVNVRRAGEVELHHVLGVSMLLLVAPQGVLPHEGGVARVTAERSGRFQFGPIPGGRGLRGVPAPAFSSAPGPLGAAAPLRVVRVALPFVDDQVAALLRGEVAGVAFEGAILRVDPLVDSERTLAGAGVGALGTLDGLSGLVLP